MNKNGHGRWLDHSIRIRSNPERRAALQAELNSYRRSRITDSLTVRPVYLPLAFNMTAAAQTSPYRDTTKSLAYDVIITGVKADSQTRDIIIRRTEDEKPLTYVGDEVALNLRTDDIAGQGATTGGGQLGVFQLPAPILLPAGVRLTVEMFKTDVTGAAEEANIVFVGVRAFKASYGAELLDPEEKQLIEQMISMREVPTVKFLKQLVEFDTAAAAGEARDLQTPQVPEPLLIRGVRTTLRQCTIELGIQGEPSWTVEPTPIWAVAGEDEGEHENYLWFSKPIFLHSNDVIEIRRVINSIDGTLIDPQNDNTITWICETV